MISETKINYDELLKSSWAWLKMWPYEETNEMFFEFYHGGTEEFLVSPTRINSLRNIKQIKRIKMKKKINE